ncbi:hypothetical protein [Nocardioides terrisoli]|uniref:hypothetical protein n=1 Tax=Nocardioides terrisoli TaxID=3388267 RepID=UPI00287B8003|nr:hypothetical protein [Nocardioides marmorisolisilvae]
MTGASVCVVLGLLVLLLLKTKGLNTGSAVVCIVFGLVLASTAAGTAIEKSLDSAGGWLWSSFHAM